MQFYYLDTPVAWFFQVTTKYQLIEIEKVWVLIYYPTRHLYLQGEGIGKGIHPQGPSVTDCHPRQKCIWEHVSQKLVNRYRKFYPIFFKEHILYIISLSYCPLMGYYYIISHGYLAEDISHKYIFCYVTFQCFVSQ